MTTLTWGREGIEPHFRARDGLEFRDTRQPHPGRRVIASFPKTMLAAIRCPADGGELVFEDGRGARCTHCGRSFELDGPVLRLGLEGLHPESEHERRLRDAEAAARPEPAWDAPGDAMEIDAMREAL